MSAEALGESQRPRLQDPRRRGAYGGSHPGQRRVRGRATFLLQDPFMDVGGPQVDIKQSLSSQLPCRAWSLLGLTSDPAEGLAITQSIPV